MSTEKPTEEFSLKLADGSQPPFTMVGNVIFDMLQGEIKASPWSVYMFLVRKTVGFQKTKDKLTVSQIEKGYMLYDDDGNEIGIGSKGTGLGRATVFRCLRLLEDEVFLIQRKHKAMTNTRGGKYTEVTYVVYIPEYDIWGNRIDAFFKAQSKKKLTGSQNETLELTGSQNETGTGSQNETKQKKTYNKKQQHGVVVNSDEPKTERDEIITLLTEQGISKGVAVKLSGLHDSGYIRNKVAYLEFSLLGGSEAIQKPSAWLRAAIEKDFAQPDGFESAEQRAEREAQEDEQDKRLRLAREAQLEALSGKDRQEQEKRQKEQSRRLRELKQEYETGAELENYWQEVLKRLETEAQSPMVYSALQECALLRVNEGSANLAVPNQGVSIMLRSNDRADVVAKILAEVLGQDEIELHLREVMRE